MDGSKAHIISQLQKQILPLQGYKPIPASAQQVTGLGAILQSFPNNRFPVGAIHEFIIDSREGTAATGGFIWGLTGQLMGPQGVSIYISSTNSLFPPALSFYNVEASNIIFINLQNEKEILWATEEALQCEALTAVITEISNISFTASRRLQLAVEKSRVTGFIIRQARPTLSTTACISRWKITSLASSLPVNIPGVGFPRWKVELMKVRNGNPGNWIVEWKDGKFEHIYRDTFVLHQQVQKAI